MQRRAGIVMACLWLGKCSTMRSVVKSKPFARDTSTGGMHNTHMNKSRTTTHDVKQSPNISYYNKSGGIGGWGFHNGGDDYISWPTTDSVLPCR